MPLTTVTVSIAAHLVVGSALPNGRVRFELTAPDVDGGIVVPQSASVSLDVNGEGSIELWPNSRGTQGTQYRVMVYDGNRNLLQKALATVPQAACDLHDIIDLAAPAVVAGTVQFADYAALRAYAGRGTTAYITGYLATAAPSDIAGLFTRDDTDTTTADNGGTIIVDGSGRRWRRVFDGAANLAWFATGDGVTVETAQIQKWLDLAGSLYVPGNTFVTRRLSVPSFTTIEFHPSARLLAATGYTTNEVLLDLTSAVDVTIYGNGAKVQMLKAEYTTGEWRHCVNIFSAVGVSIYDLKALDSGGDGFYVGGNSGSPSRSVLLSNCVGDNNRRQGLSIVNVIGCQVVGGEYKNTAGTAPECGIDVESNLLDGYYLQKVVIDGARTYNNNGGGVLVTPQSKYAPVSITVVNHTSEYDGVRGGLTLNAAMAYTPSTDAGLIGKVQGTVFVDNITIINPQGRGIGTVNWTENAPETHIGTVYVLNPCSNAALDTSDLHRCAWLIRSEVPSSGQYGSSVGNLRFDNLIARDDRAIKKMKIPLYLNIADEANKPLKNLYVGNIDALTTEYTGTSLTPVLWNATKAVNCNIAYRKPWYATSGSLPITPAFSGATFYPTIASTYTLNPAADCIGTEVEFFVRTAVALNVTPNAADTIDIYSGGVAGNAATSNTAGSRLKLRAREAGRWEVVSVVGTWT